MKIDLHTALAHAQAGRLQLEACGEILQRKFARDFAASVASCFREFRPRDSRLDDAFNSIRDCLRGRINEKELSQVYRNVQSMQRDAFRSSGATALFMRVVEVFDTTRQTFRRFYSRISAFKAIRATAEALAPRNSFDVARVADEARQAACVFAFCKRPHLAVRHYRHSHEIVPAAFHAIREAETHRQCRHVADTLRWMSHPIAINLLQQHETGDSAARSIFWDWCEEQGFNLCPSFNDIFDPVSLDRLKNL